MKLDTVGFIGCGNMGSAMINGIINKNMLNPAKIYAFDNDTEKLNELCTKLNISAASSEKEVAENCKYILLAIKPHVVKPVLNELKAYISDYNIIISIAAGVTVKTLIDASKTE